MYIPSLIDPNEKLVRFIFADNFRKGVIALDRINVSDIFLDTRNIGVSLQRLQYCSKELSRVYAEKIPNKKYVGIVIFFKYVFDQCVSGYQVERNDFEAKIDYTPLDENNQYLSDKDHCRIGDIGNPYHADLFYINPAISGEEKESGRPHTSLRLFSQKLFRVSEVFIEEA